MDTTMWVRYHFADCSYTWVPIDTLSIVTLLSIFANNAIAVPLCTTFPNHELQYIIDNSEAIVLLASEKFKEKSEEVVKLGLQKNPLLGVTEKVQEGLKQKPKKLKQKQMAEHQIKEQQRRIRNKLQHNIHLNLQRKV